MDTSAIPSTRAANRPGCISVYAIFLWVHGFIVNRRLFSLTPGGEL